MLDDKETLLLRREIAALTQRVIELRSRVAELEAALKAKQTDAVCLNAIASNEPCEPDNTLRRCTICGFIVDTKYKAELEAALSCLVERLDGDQPCHTELDQARAVLGLESGK